MLRVNVFNYQKFIDRMMGEYSLVILESIVLVCKQDFAIENVKLSSQWSLVLHMFLFLTILPILHLFQLICLWINIIYSIILINILKLLHSSIMQLIWMLLFFTKLNCVYHGFEIAVNRSLSIIVYLYGADVSVLEVKATPICEWVLIEIDTDILAEKIGVLVIYLG